MRRPLAAIAVMLGLGAALVGGLTGMRPKGVTARELAREIHDRRDGLVLIDLRAPDVFAIDALPTARNDLPADPVKASQSIVLYGGTDAQTMRADAVFRQRGVREIRLLEGGAEEWRDEVVNPILPRDVHSWTSADAEVAALSAYFGGTPRAPGDAAPKSSAVPGDRRRGC